MKQSHTEPQFTVHAGVIHSIYKDKTSMPSKINIRQELHQVNAALEHFVKYAASIIQDHGSNRSISGGFTTDNTLSKELASFDFGLKSDTDYLELSKKIVTGLYKFINKENFTTGGDVPVIFYRDDETEIEYILIFLIRLNKYINIKNGEFTDTNVIDKDALKIGLRINLNALQEHFYNQNQESISIIPYIQWIERKKSELPVFIQKFVPVGQRVNDKVATDLFLNIFQTFTELTFKNEQVRQDVEDKIYQYLEDCQKQGNTVHIEDDIDPILDSEMKLRGLDCKPSFCSYRKENDIVLDSKFSPNRKSVKDARIFKLSSKDSNISIQGRVQELGRKVKLVEQKKKKYIEIEISDDDYNTFKEKYPKLGNRNGSTR